MKTDDDKSEPETPAKSEPQVHSSALLCRICAARTVTLYGALGATGIAFDIGTKQPVAASFMMLGVVFPVLYIRERFLRHNEKGQP